MSNIVVTERDIEATQQVPEIHGDSTPESPSKVPELHGDQLSESPAKALGTSVSGDSWSPLAD
jgi:hypothetical protein